jgi:hypothetical protein
MTPNVPKRSGNWCNNMFKISSFNFIINNIMIRRWKWPCSSSMDVWLPNRSTRTEYCKVSNVSKSLILLIFSFEIAAFLLVDFNFSP